MSDFARIKSFIDGAKTGIDWLDHKGRLEEATPSEYEQGFRHALDAIGGYIDEIESEAIEKEAIQALGHAEPIRAMDS